MCFLPKVQIQVNIDELSEEELEQVQLAGFNSTNSEADSTFNGKDLPFGDAESNADSDIEDLSPTAIDFRIMINKLDSMLAIMFGHLKHLWETNQPTTIASTLNSTKKGEPQTTFQILLQAFERTILKTHKSRYTQFLIFYMASFSQTFSNDFLSLICSCMFDDSI